MVPMRLLRIYGVKYAKPHFGARIGIFKTNTLNIKACILSKILCRFQPNLAKLNTYYSWVAATSPRWRIFRFYGRAMEQGRPLYFHPVVCYYIFAVRFFFLA